MPTARSSELRCFVVLARTRGHQGAHARILLDRRLRTTRTGMRHYLDRIDLLLASVVVLLLGRDALHHRVGDTIAATRPRVDDLVVLLALRDQTILILLLKILHQDFGFIDH